MHLRTLTACVLACLAATLTQARAEADLVVGDQKGGSRALMEAAGVLTDLPYRIEWKEFAAAAPLMEAMNAGAIETGIVGDAPFTFAKAAGVHAKAIAAVRQNVAGLAILVRKTSSITTVDELKGKSIATTRGSIGHQLVLALADKHGWSRDDIHIVYLQPPDAKIAYSTGRVAAWATWEPYVAQEEVLFGARRVATAEGLTPGISYQVASDGAIARKRAQLQDFVGRLAKARAWSLTHTEAYADAWAKLIGLDVKVPRLWLSRARITLVPIDDTVVADEQKTIDLYRRHGLIAADLKASDVFDRSFNFGTQ